MKKVRAEKRGRPKTSALTRAEQLRKAKRAQRERERKAGLTTVELLLPTELAQQLRMAANAPRFMEELERFLRSQVLDIEEWPVLRDLAWNRKGRWIPAQEAFALYERNWRFVETDSISPAEARLVDRLAEQFGNGVLNV